VVSVIETACESWQATKNLPLDRAANNRRVALSKIFEPYGLMCDSFKHQIVGLSVKPNCSEIVALLLAHEGWKERPYNLLWCDDPNFPELETKSSLVEEIYRSLVAGCSTTMEIADHMGYKRNTSNIANVLVRARRYGLVTRVLQSQKGKDGYYYRYTLVSTLEDWKGHVWFHHGRKRPYHGL
jgi:hypothetical protein